MRWYRQLQRRFCGSWMEPDERCGKIPATDVGASSGWIMTCTWDQWDAALACFQLPEITDMSSATSGARYKNRKEI
jgi:hypothetical protein